LEMERITLQNYILELEEQTGTDPLTGLYNLKKFEENFSNQLKIAARKKEYPIGLIMVDLDHFKQINDNFGHKAGDLTLKETAKYFQSTVRAGDSVYRIGGEEFLILAPDTNLRKGISLAERLRKGIGDAVERKVLEDLCKRKSEKVFPDFNVTASFGIIISKGAEDMDELRKSVDKALYFSKNNGRNSLSIYSKGKATLYKNGGLK
jgi:diguanylate cyclase (GGDEF)-like protein